MNIKQDVTIEYNLTCDEETYETIKASLRYTAEKNSEQLRGEASDLLSIFPAKRHH